MPSAQLQGPERPSKAEQQLNDEGSAARSEAAGRQPCSAQRHGQRRNAAHALDKLHATQQPPVAAKPKATKQQPGKVSYGADWYKQTRNAMQGGDRPRTVAEQIAERKAANWKANNGRERKDLYTDAWDGSEFKGGKVNILTVILAISILTPLGLIIFAVQSYGTLWG